MEDYTKLSYKEMRTKLANLAKLFPEVIKLETAEKKLEIPYLVDCDDKLQQKCVLDIVTLTDSQVPDSEKV